jgi:toxin ParE1/3/4
VKLRYTLRGAAELDKVLAYIDERSPQGARRVQMRIQAIINLLLQHPHAGQRTSKGRLRRIVASPYPYLIFYMRPRTRS